MDPVVIIIVLLLTIAVFYKKDKKKECYYGYNTSDYDYGILTSMYNKNYNPKYSSCNIHKKSSKPLRRYFGDFYNHNNDYYPRQNDDYFFTRYT